MEDKKFLQDEIEVINDNLLPMLTRDQILESNDIQEEIVEVPEWGGTVTVRGMTGDERDKFESTVMHGKGKNIQLNWRSIRAKLVANTVVNGDGGRMFSDQDVTKLGKKSARALDRVFDVSQRLSGITKEDVEDLAKN
jgi:hypothetical protein